MALRDGEGRRDDLHDGLEGEAELARRYVRREGGEERLGVEGHELGRQRRVVRAREHREHRAVRRLEELHHARRQRRRVREVRHGRLHHERVARLRAEVQRQVLRHVEVEEVERAVERVLRDRPRPGRLDGPEERGRRVAVARERVERREVGERVHLEGVAAVARRDEVEVPQRVERLGGHHGRHRMLLQVPVEQTPGDHGVQHGDDGVHDLLEELPQRRPRGPQRLRREEDALFGHLQLRQLVCLPVLEHLPRKRHEVVLELQHDARVARVLHAVGQEPRQRAQAGHERLLLQLPEMQERGRALGPHELVLRLPHVRVDHAEQEAVLQPVPAEHGPGDDRDERVAVQPGARRLREQREGIIERQRDGGRRRRRLGLPGLDGEVRGRDDGPPDGRAHAAAEGAALAGLHAHQEAAEDEQMLPAARVVVGAPEHRGRPGVAAQPAAGALGALVPRVLDLVAAHVDGRRVVDADDAVARAHAVPAAPYCRRREQLRGEQRQVQRVREVREQHGGRAVDLLGARIVVHVLEELQDGGEEAVDGHGGRLERQWVSAIGGVLLSISGCVCEWCVFGVCGVRGVCPCWVLICIAAAMTRPSAIGRVRTWARGRNGRMEEWTRQCADCVVTT